MLLQAYGAIIAVVVVSMVLGSALCGPDGHEQRWWAAPGGGMGALIIIAGAAIKLPGKAVTAVVVLALALAAAGAFLWRRRVSPVRLEDLLVAGIPLLAMSIPFIGSGRAGLPGIGVLDDTANHLLWAEALRSSRMAALWAAQGGYPLGPHSVVATLGTAFGMPLDMAFTGLIFAIPVITALVAAGLMVDQALWRRAVVAVMTSLAYLFIGYTGQAAFKETIMASLLVAFAVHLAQAQVRWRTAPAGLRWWLAAPAVVLAAAGVYTYSYPAVAWFGLTGVVWLAAEAALRPATVRSWISLRRLSSAAPWIGETAVFGLILVAPVAGQALSFLKSTSVSPTQTVFTITTLANLVHSLSPYEALGIWLQPDFRFDPANAFHAGELSALALAAFVFGMIWSVCNRRLPLAATAIACALIWWVSDRNQSPYVSAKALAIASPLIMAVGLRALLTRSPGPRWTQAALLGAAALFCGFAAYSTLEELRNVPIQAPEPGRELAAFHRTIGDSTVLFLGVDEYSRWELRDAAVTTIAGNAPLTAAPVPVARLRQPIAYVGDAVGFDSIVPTDLDNFRYVITSNTSYASQPYANFRLLSSMRLYDLWERTGPTVPRQTFAPPGAPGAILDCGSATGQRLKADGGVASTMATPITVPGPSMHAGGSASVSLPLPRGRWDLSIQYYGSFEVHLSAQGHRWSMPAYLGRPGPFLAVGSVTGHGTSSPVTLTISAERPSFVTGISDNLFVSVPSIAATQIPDVRRIMPLSHACGRFVDWYRP